MGVRFILAALSQENALVHREPGENMTTTKNDGSGSEVQPIVRRPCRCNGLCRKDELPDGFICTMGDQLDLHLLSGQERCLRRVERWIDDQTKMMPGDIDFVCAVQCLSLDWRDNKRDGMDALASHAMDRLAKVVDAMKTLI